MSSEKYIEVRAARVNNLKSINLLIPRNKFIVVTGLSGSGKSSLAFETLYAEGQRRYVESLSSYARQFLGRMSKPECDHIIGLPPAIAIEQKVNSRNPRSTVGTSSEVYDYLRMLFARVGKTYSPVSGELVTKHSAEDVISTILSWEDNERFVIMTPLIVPEDKTVVERLMTLEKQGFTRIVAGEEFVAISDLLARLKKEEFQVEQMIDYLLVDRLSVKRDNSSISRMNDSIETAFFEGHGECVIRRYQESGTTDYSFSKRFEADGIEFEEPTDLMFNFNSPAGACPMCEGFGKVMGIDEDLVVPNKSLSLMDNAVVCWRGEKLSEWLQFFIQNTRSLNFPIYKPYYELSEAEKELLWDGTVGGNRVEGVEGINDFFKFLEANLYKIQNRVMLARYRGRTTCPMCRGSRLKPEASYVKVGGRTIQELVGLSIIELARFFDALELTEHDAIVAERLLKEIRSRLHFLLDVGLSYLTLNRLSNSLSGGESQRINLATSLGSSLVGSLYILDEPSIGLHSRDSERLIRVLRELRDLGNTVLVVEHDEEIIRSADHIIDIGPDAGVHGGEVVGQWDVVDGRLVPFVMPEGSFGEEGGDPTVGKHSYTYDFLNHIETIPVPEYRRKWNNYLSLSGVNHNNLKNVEVKVPLNILTVVSGVSGSGKSSLIRDVLYQTLFGRLNGNNNAASNMATLSGDTHLVKRLEMVDQNPIGKSSRSNPCTYLKAYDEIRKLYAECPLSHQMGYSASHFSFNVEGGRCETCKGDGTITVEMQFMADLELECEECHGKRFKSEILEVEYRGKNIHDVLHMSVNQAIEFFSASKGLTEKKIVKKLLPLQQVGLGYIQLGQSSSTLSGGENQRVKLAFFLSAEKVESTLFIFDEPTTGLHFHDIKTLMKALNALVDRGHTVVIIEHNLDVIRSADYLIDMGPEGGDGGGRVVFAGTPEEMKACEESYTAKYL